MREILITDIKKDWQKKLYFKAIEAAKEKTGVTKIYYSQFATDIDTSFNELLDEVVFWFVLENGSSCIVQ